MLKTRNDFFSELAALADCDGFYEAGWRERFSPFVDFDTFRERFLSSAGENTHWMYCPERLSCEHGCPLEVVRDLHEYYAVCVEGKVPPCRIPLGDVKIEKFNFPLFHWNLAELLALESAVEPLGGGLSWCLGTWPKIQRRVLLSYVSPRELAKEAIRLALSDNIPLIVFTPYRTPLREDDLCALVTAKVIRLAISEFVSVDHFCRLSLLPEFLKQFPRLFEDEAPSAPKASNQIPSGLFWPDIHLRFLDQHTLSCRVGVATWTFSFHDFNMVNHRTGAPDANWFYLLLFAENQGAVRVDWRSPVRARREQQRKRRLSKALQAFFHIDADPIAFDRESFSYTSLFRIRPESDSAN